MILKSYLVEVPERVYILDGRKITLPRGWRLKWGYITTQDAPLWI